MIHVVPSFTAYKTHPTTLGRKSKNKNNIALDASALHCTVMFLVKSFELKKHRSRNRSKEVERSLSGLIFTFNTSNVHMVDTCYNFFLFINTLYFTLHFDFNFLPIRFLLCIQVSTIENYSAEVINTLLLFFQK